MGGVGRAGRAYVDVEGLVLLLPPHPLVGHAGVQPVGEASQDGAVLPLRELVLSRGVLKVPRDVVDDCEEDKAEDAGGVDKA